MEKTLCADIPAEEAEWLYSRMLVQRSLRDAWRCSLFQDQEGLSKTCEAYTATRLFESHSWQILTGRRVTLKQAQRLTSMAHRVEAWLRGTDRYHGQRRDN